MGVGKLVARVAVVEGREVYSPIRDSTALTGKSPNLRPSPPIMQDSKTTSRARFPGSITLLFSLGLTLCASCASTSSENDPEPVDETYRPLGPASRNSDSIGKYLADLSTSITAWNAKTLSATTSKERRKHNLLEINIRERAKKRYTELLRELETGPEHNRIIAAAAIGFAKRPSSLSPLLASLDDASDEVVGNALFSLGLLEAKETPLHEIGDLLRFSPNSRTRWSAANSAFTLIAAGADPTGILEPARAGITDAEEPVVRSQSALILALIGDTSSIDALGGLVFDEVPLVSRAAVESLSYLGRHNSHHMGAAARQLCIALAEGDRKLRLRVHPGLVQLSKRDYGLDTERWTEWVKKLP